MSDENSTEENKPKESNSGCLPVFIFLVIILSLIVFLNKSDEYDEFIENAKNANETPYLYLPNKETKEYCINLDIRNKGLVTLCSQRNSKIKAYSNCFYHKTGLTGGHVKELTATAMMYYIGSAKQISEEQAADMAKGTVCTKYHGDGVYEKARTQVESDIMAISANKEEAKELKVSFKCFNAYQADNNTTECSKKEIEKIEKKYKNLEAWQEEELKKAEQEAEKLRQKRIPKEEKLAKKIGVSRNCLVTYENNYYHFSDKEIYEILKDECTKEELNKLIDYFDFHPNEHLEELPNGF